MPDMLPGYTYDRRSGRYRNLRTGRWVAQRQITGLLASAVQAGEETVLALTTAYQDGELAPAVYLAAMRMELRRLHSQNRALGRGGWAQMGALDWLTVGNGLRGEMDRLCAFAQEIAAGSVTLPQALNRARMYVGTARVQYWQAAMDRTPGPGMVAITKRDLGVAEHCPSCLDYHALGWRPAGELPAPGVMSECMSNCRCSMEWREVPAREADQWINTRRRR